MNRPSQENLPKEPSKDWVQTFLGKSLMDAAGYKLEDEPMITAKLDQNECPWDWPVEVKNLVLEKLGKVDWSRYPSPFSEELTIAISKHIGIGPQYILTGPGSNAIIAMVFDAVGPRLAQGKMVVARPSFALFESQCQYSGIPFETWNLDHNLNYDLSKMPDLPPGSMVVFASPNNPTGSTLEQKDLVHLLESHPDVLFFADEAYFEFSEGSYQDLLGSHSNLLILRTFSKTLGAAGLRIGYLLGSEAMISQISKRRLPYLLNHFCVIAAQTMMEHPRMAQFLGEHVEHVKLERERVYQALTSHAAGEFEVKNSEANFVLIRFKDQAQCMEIHQSLASKGIMVRNVSKGPMLQGCLRVSIGKKEENDRLIQALQR